MDNLKLRIAMSSLVKMFEKALETVGYDTLENLEKQLAQMNEQQRLDFITMVGQNPYTTLKSSLASLEKQYEAFRNDPVEIERAKQALQKLLTLQDEQTVEETKEENNDDDTTKH